MVRIHGRGKRDCFTIETTHLGDDRLLRPFHLPQHRPLWIKPPRDAEGGDAVSGVTATHVKLKTGILNQIVQHGKKVLCLALQRPSPSDATPNGTGSDRRHVVLRRSTNLRHGLIHVGVLHGKVDETHLEGNSRVNWSYEAQSGSAMHYRL